ncbi:MAG: hypothetical protein SFV15_20565 [Polyangiaceae bacterium]|nr:hypothetical protein [Polyangiaceae bacterium]
MKQLSLASGVEVRKIQLMKNTLVAAACGLIGFAAAPEARAQTLGKPLDVVFSGDRLFGVSFSKQITGRPGQPDDVFDSTRIGFGWSGRTNISPYEVPRAAVDVFVTEQLSLGGSLGFANVSMDDNDGRRSSSTESIVFAPRVGYLWPISTAFSFWLRGGFTYHSTDPGNENGLGLTAEPTFVLTPAEHFGIVFGPTLDVDFSGAVDSGPNRVMRHYQTIGLIQVGILGWL